MTRLRRRRQVSYSLNSANAAFNQLTQRVVDPDGALGAAALQTHDYLWDGGELVGVYGYNSLVFAYGPAPDMVLFESTAWLHALLGDHQNTVRDVIESAFGTLENHLVYNSYRELKSQTGGGAYSPFHRFTGKPFDTAVGLQYNLNRWYDPSIGRWISEDPIGFAGGDANLIRYVGNGPMNFTDPLGKRKRFGARAMLYGELRAAGYGAAVDSAHGTHVSVQQGIDTAVHMTPGLGDVISAIEVVTGENALLPGQTLSDGERIFGGAVIGLGIILGGVRYADDLFGAGSGSARNFSSGASFVAQHNNAAHSAAQLARLNASLRLQEILGNGRILGPHGSPIDFGHTRLAVLDTQTGLIHYGPSRAGGHFQLVESLGLPATAEGRFVGGAVEVLDSGNINFIHHSGTYPPGHSTMTLQHIDDFIRGAGANPVGGSGF